MTSTINESTSRAIDEINPPLRWHTSYLLLWKAFADFEPALAQGTGRWASDAEFHPSLVRRGKHRRAGHISQPRWDLPKSGLQDVARTRATPGVRQAPGPKLPHRGGYSGPGRSACMVALQRDGEGGCARSSTHTVGSVHARRMVRSSVCFLSITPKHHTSPNGSCSRLRAVSGGVDVGNDRGALFMKGDQRGKRE